jgi:hypothetical protein
MGDLIAQFAFVALVKDAEQIFLADRANNHFMLEVSKQEIVFIVALAFRFDFFFSFAETLSPDPFLLLVFKIKYVVLLQKKKKTN